jgi:poly-gamma-glutamate capsule biosynthesis protein CapA/YwtB (metallophosphatase superfamily)
MTGRGIDQIMPHPSKPGIHEPYVRDARTYVELAEDMNGPIPAPVCPAYIWGDAREILEKAAPDVRIINLETSITTSEAYWRGKGINYRMHPANIPCLTVAGIDVVSLANNHVIDWGYAGLAETLRTLVKAGLKTAGAGNTAAEASAPAIVELKGKGRVLVFTYGSETSGIPPDWAAGRDKPGVNLLPDLSDAGVGEVRSAVRAVKRPGDVVVASIHWGGNWGYGIPAERIALAHRLIDEAGVDAIHGHSSHHPQGIEVYRGRPIIYGCGDFINDYEGIRGNGQFRGELSLMYFLQVESATGRLISLKMKPTRIRSFRVQRADRGETLWLRDMLNREGKRFGTRVEMEEDATLTLRWQ